MAPQAGEIEQKYTAEAFIRGGASPAGYPPAGIPVAVGQIHTQSPKISKVHLPMVFILLKYLGRLRYIRRD